MFVAPPARKRGANKCIFAAQTQKRGTNKCLLFPKRESEERTFVFSSPSAKAGNEQMYFRRPDAKAGSEQMYFRSPARKRATNKCIFVPQRKSEERTNVFSLPRRENEERTFVFSFPSAKARSEHLYFRRPDAKAGSEQMYFRSPARKRGANKCLSLPQRESKERTFVFSPPRRESGQRTFVLSFPSAKAGNEQMYFCRRDAKAGNEQMYFRSPAQKRRPNICTFVPQREVGEQIERTCAAGGFDRLNRQNYHRKPGGVLGCPQAVLGRVGRFGGARNHRFGSRGCLAPPKPLRKASRKKKEATRMANAQKNVHKIAPQLFDMRQAKREACGFASSTGLPAGCRRSSGVSPQQTVSAPTETACCPAPLAGGAGLSSQIRPSARERRRGKHHGERHALRDVTPSAKAGGQIERTCAAGGFDRLNRQNYHRKHRRGLGVSPSRAGKSGEVWRGEKPPLRK